MLGKAFCRARGMSARTALLAAGLVFALSAAALMVRAYASGEEHVTIDNFSFSPATLTVPAGTTVMFENDDDIPHTVVAVDKSFRSKALDTLDKFTVTLTKPGEFEYFCGLHPRMTGKIIVTP